MERSPRETFLIVFEKLATLLIRHYCPSLERHVTDPLKRHHLLVDILRGAGTEIKFTPDATSYCLSWSLDWLVKCRNHFIHSPTLPLNSTYIWNLARHVIPILMTLKLELPAEARDLLYQLGLSLKEEVKDSGPSELKNVEVSIAPPEKPISQQQRRTQRDWCDSVPLLKSIPEPSTTRRLADIKDNMTLRKLLLGKDVQLVTGVHAGFMAKIILWNGNNVCMVLSTAEHKYIESNKVIKFPLSYLEE